MNSEALIWMLTIQTIVTSFAGYFFFKVLFVKPKPVVEDDEDDAED